MLDVQAAFNKFRDEAGQIQHSKRLHVFIADEAHWGIKGGSVHDKYVNDNTLTNQHNSVVLLVTATPANLLTGSSRVPEVYLTSGNSQHTGKALVPSFSKGCEKQSQREHEDAYSSLQMQTIPSRVLDPRAMLAGASTITVPIEHTSKVTQTF